jgi:tRNA (cytidine/uridine-2'-O-)-methyltransferase
MRLGACLGAELDIIEPCGFPLTDRALKRTAMDYAGMCTWRRHDSWSAFLRAPERREGRLVLFTTRGALPLGQMAFSPHDTLLFGRESAGVPDEVHDACDARVFIPLQPGARSLNVAMAAAIALWEAGGKWRQD